MRKMIVALAAIAPLAGCSTAEQGAASSAAALPPAPVTAPQVGGAGSTKVGAAARAGWCVYRDSRGTLYEARCT
jgi:hypothetical protein